jgi:gamma-glutamylputrescine oxidase
MFSFWERESFWKSADVIILGSGIVGLNAAIHLKRKSPNLRVTVLERGFLPYGASTRNAGFACFGSASELIADLKIQGESEVLQLVEKRWKGLQRMRHLLGDAAIQYEGFGGYEIFRVEDQIIYEACCDQLPSLNHQLEDIIGTKQVFDHINNSSADFGFNNVNHIICNKMEGQINTGAMMKALLEMAKTTGVEVLTGVTITGTHPEDGRIVLVDENGFHFPCRQLLVATNGFAKSLLPDLNVEPARAQVFITQPVEGLKLRGSFHIDEGYYYFRNVGNRILLGGGRNLDFKGEQTTIMSLTERIQHHLEKLLRDIICPYTTPVIDMRWSGIMGMGNEKSSIIKRLDNHTVCAVRMGGMGVAIGGLAGEEAADLVLDKL